MDLKISFDEQWVLAQATKVAQERASTIANQTVTDYFSSKRNYNSKDGPGTLIVKEKIDQYLLSADVDAMIQGAVERCLQRSIEHLAQEVVRQGLGKILFAESPNKLDLERVRSIFRDALAGDVSKPKEQVSE